MSVGARTTEGPAQPPSWAGRPAQPRRAPSAGLIWECTLGGACTQQLRLLRGVLPQSLLASEPALLRLVLALRRPRESFFFLSLWAQVSSSGKWANTYPEGWCED